MRALIYHVATSADGFIARPNGSFEDFPFDAEVVEDFFAAIGEFGSVLMGRKTYEVGLAEGKTNPYPGLESLVFSRTLPTSPDPAVRLISNGAVEVVRELKEREGKAIWLCGGADLAGQLCAAGLVDELVVKLNPLLLGSGIPLFSTVVEPTRLELLEHKAYTGGTLRLRYRLAS